MEPRLTPKEMLEGIVALQPKWFGYVNQDSKSKARVCEVDPAKGILKIKRKGPRRVGASRKAEEKSISQGVLERVAAALSTRQPVSLEAILDSGGNARSLLEAVLARLPEIHVVYLVPADPSGRPVPGARPHKHIAWIPGFRHRIGAVSVLTAERFSRHAPSACFLEPEARDVSSRGKAAGNRKHQDLEHHEIQAGLADAAHRIGLKSWIASNDRNKRVKGRVIGKIPGVLHDLDDAPGFSGNPAAVNRGKRIDNIFFDGDVVRAAFEIEHTTRVTSGLTRMNGLRSVLRGKRVGAWIIVAADGDRDLVMREATRPDLAPLRAKYMSYTNLRRLFRVCAEGPFTSKMPAGFLSNFYEECVV